MAADAVLSRPAAGAPRAISAEAATAWLVAVGALARLWIGATNGLCYGESYYYSGALRPSLSYFDQPPLSILLGTAGLWVAGEPGRLVLRLPFIALFAGTTGLAFLLGRRLFGAWAGFYGALLLNLSPIFTVSVGVLFQPEGPLMCFSLACVWCLVHLLIGPPPRRALLWWAAAGAALGLAMLSKYPAVLLVAGAGLYVVSHRDQRRWLAHPGPYVALAIAALLFSPVLVWNAQHGWVSFWFQSTRGLGEAPGVRIDWLLRNVAGQAIAMLPWLWAALVAELARGTVSRAAGPARRLLACLALPPIVLFTALAAYSATGQHHFHWTTPGYLLLFPALGDTVARGLARGRALYRWGLGATAAVSVLLVAAVTSHIATGWITRAPLLSAALAGREDPTLECIDFTAIRPALAERGLLGRPDVFVFSDWWFRAGKVDYALGGQMPVLAFTRDDPRNFAFFERSERWVGKDGILVTTKDTAGEVAGHFGRYFERIAPLGAVDVGRGGRAELRLYLYRCEGLKMPYPQPYG